MNSYHGQDIQKSSAGMLQVRETIKESLMRQRSEVQAHIDNLDSAIRFLADNPNFEAFYDTLRKAGF